MFFLCWFGLHKKPRYARSDEIFYCARCGDFVERISLEDYEKYMKSRKRDK